MGTWRHVACCRRWMFVQIYFELDFLSRSRLVFCLGTSRHGNSFKPLLGCVSILVFVTIDFFQRVLVKWWNASEFKEFAADSSEFKCAWD
jgi:hypothetical protein